MPADRRALAEAYCKRPVSIDTQDWVLVFDPDKAADKSCEHLIWFDVTVSDRRGNCDTVGFAHIAVDEIESINAGYLTDLVNGHPRAKPPSVEFNVDPCAVRGRDVEGFTVRGHAVYAANVGEFAEAVKSIIGG